MRHIPCECALRSPQLRILFLSLPPSLQPVLRRIDLRLRPDPCPGRSAGPTVQISSTQT